MFGPKKPNQESPKMIQTRPDQESLDRAEIKKQLDDQNQIIRELFEMVKLMANHKRFEYIQKKIDNIQILLDKGTK